MTVFVPLCRLTDLTHDPELNETPSGTKVATFGVAANCKFRKADGTQDERTCFVDVVVWDWLAETCAHYLKKGKRVFIEGRLEYCVWEADGQRRSKHEVHAKTVQFLSPPDAPSVGSTDDT